jgi:hypothetical protein
VSILNKHIPFVNEQIAFHEKQATRFSSGKYASEFRSKQHNATKEKFTELAADLIKVDSDLDNPSQTKSDSLVAPPQQLILSLEEVEGLPEDLVKELSSAAVLDKGDSMVLQIMKDYGGIISLDRLLIDLYKKTGEINKRTTLTSRLYRMTQRGLVFSVPSKKGFYSRQQLTEEDALKLFGESESQNELNA